MTQTKNTTILLDADTRAQLNAQAEETDETVNDLIVGAACRAFKIPYTPSARGRSWNAGQSESAVVHVRMPVELHRAVKQKALDDNVSMGDVLLRAAVASLRRRARAA